MNPLQVCSDKPGSKWIQHLQVATSASAILSAVVAAASLVIQW
jgi:hypothetical protein